MELEAKMKLGNPHDSSVNSETPRSDIRRKIRLSESDLLREKMLSDLQKRLSRVGGKLRLVADFPDGRSVTMTLKGRIVSISED